jgi:hypothetical protein
MATSSLDSRRASKIASQYRPTAVAGSRILEPRGRPARLERARVKSRVPRGRDEPCDDRCERHGAAVRTLRPDEHANVIVAAVVKDAWWDREECLGTDVRDKLAVLAVDTRETSCSRSEVGART